MAREFDSPWKEGLDFLLDRFLEMFYLDLHAVIDWDIPIIVLDTELESILREAELGKTVADRLYRVTLKDGTDRILLIHIEVQTQRDPLLAKRMFVYSYRIRDRYDLPLVGLAILGDGELNWRPNEYFENHFGCETRYRFRLTKLIDFLGREAELETNSNPISFLVLAHLASLATNRQPEARFEAKWRLIRRMLLENESWTPDLIRRLFRLIDWFLDLPSDFAERLKIQMVNLDQERKMPWLSDFERRLQADMADRVIAEVTERVRAEVTERVQAEVTERVQAEVTERVQAEVTERVQAEVTERVQAEYERKSYLEWLEFGIDIKFGLPGLALMKRIREFQSLETLKTVREMIRNASDLSILESQLMQLAE